MRTQIWKGFSLFMVFALILGVNVAIASPNASGPTPTNHIQLDHKRPVLEDSAELSGVLPQSIINKLNNKTGKVDIVVELRDRPSVMVYSDAKVTLNEQDANLEAVNQLQNIQKAQDSFITLMNKNNIAPQILFRTQRVLNGIYMKVDASKVKEIAKLKGVKAIYPLVPKQLDNNYSIPLIGAPQVWQTYFARGEGVKIGIIDTGIDYLHTDFGGPGTGYDTNDFTIDEPGTADGFPSAKVVGGYDFVGDNYDANDSTSVPQPDPDPMDCNGHGSHVAGTVAGYGTNSDGTTYSGGYTTSTPFTSTMDIGPGVAPLAKLYALRVFGCSGSTNVVEQAIEWAVDPNGDGKFDDHLDVINMSLGSPYGTEYDTSAVAANNAALAGVIVVASAGNSGDTHYINGSPATGTNVISVAASQDAGNINTYSKFQVNSPSDIAGFYPDVEAGFGPTLDSDITADLGYDSTNYLGCNAFSSGYFSGKIALIARGDCLFVVKVKNAQNAGAVAVLIYNNASTAPFEMGGSDPTITIPSAMIFKSDGELFVSKLSSGSVNVTLSPDWHLAMRLDPGADPSLIDLPSSFSSRGPRRIDSFPKPDISAPGDTIYSVSALSGKYGTSMSGTSMAAPHMTGVMALLRQWKSNWSVAELKADVMNTATYDITPSSTKYSPQRVGAGRVNVPAAIATDVIMYSSDNPGGVSVSFGAPEVTTSISLEKVITLKSKATAGTYTPSVIERSSVPGVSFELLDMDDNPLSTVSVTAGGTTEFKLKMSADPSAMTHTHDATLSEVQLIRRFWMAEASGLIQLVPSSGVTLRLPYYAAPRPASTLKAHTSSVFVDQSGNAQLDLDGTAVNTTGISSSPVGESSMTTALELLDSSSNDDLGYSPEIERILDAADLKYVGAMTDAHLYGSVEDSDAEMYFGIATQNTWSSLNDVEFDIYIDVDQDGNTDYILFNWNYGKATGGADATDTFMTLLYVVATDDLYLEDYINNISPRYFNTVAFNNNVVVLPVYTADFLTDSDPTFDFQVVTFSTNELTSPIDISNVMTYDASRPALDTTDGYVGLPGYTPGGPIPLHVDFNAGRDAGDLLLLYHHNAAASVPKAEAVKVFDHIYYFPFVAK